MVDHSEPVDYERIPLSQFAGDGVLCSCQESREAMLLHLWRRWTAIDTTKMPTKSTVLVLDCKGITRFEHQAVLDVLAAVYHMVLENHRPCYFIIDNIPDKAAQRELSLNFREVGVVVVCRMMTEEGLHLLGDGDRINRYITHWQTLMGNGDQWVAGRKFEADHRFPRNLLEQMYDDGIVLKSVLNRLLYKPLTLPAKV